MNSKLQSFGEVKGIKVIKGTKGDIKLNYYNQLLAMPEGIREELMNNINDQYGYDYLNTFELMRHELLTRNTQDYSNNIENNLVLDTYQQHSSIAKDMQRGYMQLLTNQCS